MCTVTFIPKTESDFMLTSNRDEAPGRETFPPKIYHENGVDILYPRDAVAGGTWIGVSKKRRAVTLMNGGFVAHIRKPLYARSRGLIVKDLLTVENIKRYSETYNFSEIEPFTAIGVDFNETLKLFQMVWTGEELVLTELPIKPKIWSSSPLYPPELVQKRETWFSEFLTTEKNDFSDILHFHRTAGEGDSISNLVMDREFVKTKSTTQIIKSAENISMYYYDLETDKDFKSVLE